MPPEKLTLDQLRLSLTNLSFRYQADTDLSRRDMIFVLERLTTKLQSHIVSLKENRPRSDAVSEIRRSIQLESTNIENANLSWVSREAHVLELNQLLNSLTMLVDPDPDPTTPVATRVRDLLQQAAALLEAKE